MSFDLAAGKGGNAQSCGEGKTGDAGRRGNGDVELRRKGILNGDMGRLLCIAGDALRVVFPAIGFGKCWSDLSLESTSHFTVSLSILCV